jgi:hypothetical protein
LADEEQNDPDQVLIESGYSQTVIRTYQVRDGKSCQKECQGEHGGPVTGRTEAFAQDPYDQENMERYGINEVAVDRKHQCDEGLYEDKEKETIEHVENILSGKSGLVKSYLVWFSYLRISN